MRHVKHYFMKMLSTAFWIFSDDLLDISCESFLSSNDSHEMLSNYKEISSTVFRISVKEHGYTWRF